MPQVSHSEVKLFRKCMKAHDYKYRQFLKRKRRTVPMVKGSILHDMLNALVMHKKLKNYQGPDPWQVLDKYEAKYRDLFQEEQEKYGDVIGDCTAIFEGYMAMYKKDPLTYEASEEFVATDLIDGVRFVGIIDKVAVDKEGRRWIVDHKFVRSIPTAEQQFPELQLLFYVWARERWAPNDKIDGIIWDYARTKAPAIPEVLKSGELSKRKNIDTTQAVYLKTIGEHGLDHRDYVDILGQLEGKENSFFQRAKLPRPPKTMIDQVVEDFKTTTVMIQKMEGIAPRSMNQFNCQGCEFRSLCESEIRGQDSEFVKKTQYEERGRHAEDLSDADQEEVE